MERLSEHGKGLLLTTLGVLIITPDTLLIRLVAIDPWSMMVWRGLLQTVGVMAILFLIYRGETMRRCLAIGWSGTAAGCLFTATTIGFLISLQHTAVANTLVIVATAPFFAAIFSFVLLRERIPRRTVLAIGAAIAGVAVMVSESWGGGAFLGDAAALMTAAALGGKFTVFRHRRETNMVPSLAVAGLFSVALGLAVTTPVLVEGERLAYLLIMGLVVVPIASGLVSLGPRYISAPEVSLIFLLETALGPLWVWLVLNEAPPAMTFVGGAIVLTTLVVHSWVDFRSRRAVAALSVP